MNPDFFVQTGMIKNAHYSALFPYGARLGTVIKNKVEIDVLSFTQAEGVLDALSKNKNLKFIAADDVYIAPSTELELTFNCK